MRTKEERMEAGLKAYEFQKASKAYPTTQAVIDLLDTGKHMTATEVALRLGVTKQRIYQIWTKLERRPVSRGQR